MTDHPTPPVPHDPDPYAGPGAGGGPPVPTNGQPRGYAQARDPEWGAPWGAEEEGGFDWRQYASAFLRYKWLILLMFALGLGGGYAAWTQIEPEYAAQGSLWIQAADGDDRGPVTTEGLLQAGSWVDLLRSFAVLDTVVVEEGLYLRTSRAPDLPLFDGFRLADRFVPGSYRLEVADDGRVVTLLRDGSPVERAEPGEPIGQAVGFEWRVPTEGLEPGGELGFTVVNPRDAAARLREDLVTQFDPRVGSFIRLELRSRNPERAASTVNRIMERHVALAAELKRGHLDEQTAILERQLEQVAAELEEAERRLQGFQVETVTLPSEDRMAIQPGLEMTRAPVFNEYFRMRADADERRRDIRRIQDVLDGLGDGPFPVEAVELIPAVTTSSQLEEALVALVAARSERRELMTRYTAEHPRVVEVADRIAALERDRLPALLESLLGQLRQEEQALEERIAASGADLGEIPPRAIEEARLRRRVAIAESRYTDLRARYETAQLARQSSLPDVRILDRAQVPSTPSNDQRARIVLMIVAGCLGAGFAGALLLDRMDSRIRTPDEVSSAVGLGVLGAVPRLRWTNGKKGTRNVNQVYEAFRELRTNLEYAYGSAGPMVLTISSPAAEEGKTLVTTNLGIAFAGLGRRTLVIDGDTRRGDLHHYLEGRRKPGLVDYLRATNGPDEIVQSTAYHGLSFIGSGTHVPNSPELLSSARMGRLFGDLRKRYDVILMDSPPLAAGADPLVLASLTGHMILVIRSGSTDRALTQAKIEPLHRLPIRLLGVVLNDFVPDRLSNYYRYYGSYLSDYEAGVEYEEGQDEADANARQRIVGAGAEAEE